VTVMKNYHVNSNTPTEEYLVPLKLTWTATGALEAGKVEYPKGQMETYEFGTVSVYTGSFDLAANFKVGANAAAGPGTATGKLKYQACSNKACYPAQNRRRNRVLPGAVGPKPYAFRKAPIDRVACRSRCSFSISANRTCPSPSGPKPMPGDTATCAFSSTSFAKSSDVCAL